MSRADDILKNEGLVRTDMHCHSCSEQALPSNFIARIDYNLEGNHEIECPRCGHLHYRVVRKGVVSEDRYNSSHVVHKVTGRNVWKSATQPVITSTASMFLRDRWLNREN